MAVHKTGNGRWRAQPCVGKVQLPTKMFAKRKEAVAWERDQLALHSAHISTTDGRLTVESHLGPYLTIVRGSRADSTADRTESIMGGLPSWFLRLPVGDVTGVHIQQLLNTWTGTRKKTPPMRSTLMTVRATVSGFFSHLVRARAISANPVKGSRVPEAPAPRVGKMLTTEELALTYQEWATHDPASADIALVLATTGLRWSELRALRACDVIAAPTHTALYVCHSWRESRKQKSTKSNRDRTVPIPHFVEPIFAAARSGKGPEDVLFPGLWAKRFKERLHWKETVPDFRLHDLRHTAISNWLAAGVDLITARDWAGHRSIEVTNRYAHHNGVQRDFAAVTILNQQHALSMHSEKGEHARVA
jgi:integrase